MIRKPSNTRTPHRDGPNSTPLRGFSWRRTGAEPHRLLPLDGTAPAQSRILMCRRVEKQPVINEALNRGHRSPLVLWNSSEMSAPVEPVLGSTPLLRFGNVRSPPVILAALPALSCQVWKCPISEPPILSRIRKTSKLVTSWATAGYRLRDRTPNLRRGPRSKLGALITLTGLSGVYSLSRAQLRVMSLSLRFHRLVSM